jgi:hypothetical protein
MAKDKSEALGPGPAVAKPARKRRRWGLWLFLVLVVLPIGLLALWTWGTLNYSYSSGERAGYVQKIAKKGWVCKTWEGEMAITNLPGTAPQLFLFTVPSDAVAQKILDASGKRVALTYQQHLGVPTSCFGETEFYITGVRTLGQ